MTRSESKIEKRTRLKPMKRVYLVMNYEGFREIFYKWKDAKEFALKEGMMDGELHYQVYKVDVHFREATIKKINPL